MNETTPRRRRVARQIRDAASVLIGKAAVQAASLPARPPREAEALALAARARERLAAAEAQRQLNIEAVLRDALGIAGNGLSTDVPEAGWLASFFAGAAEAGDDRQRRLWALALAEEAARPGAVARRTLTVLRDLSPADIALFTKLARLVVSNFAVRLPEPFLERRGLGSDELLYLEELGLLRGQRDSTKIFRSQRDDAFQTHLLYADKVLRVAHDDPHKVLTLSSHRLTRAGTDLAHLLRGTADPEYLMEIVRLVDRQGFKMHQANIVARSGPDVVTRHTRFFEIVVYDPSRRQRLARDRAI
ncbi:MAG: hypothetical protein OHK0024_15820 [Thalassobaculales bacterium]